MHLIQLIGGCLAISSVVMICFASIANYNAVKNIHHE